MSVSMAECAPHTCEYCDEDIDPNIAVSRDIDSAWSGPVPDTIYLHEECVYHYDNERDVY